MDRGAWRVTVHGVPKSQTRLKPLSMHARATMKAPNPNRWTTRGFCSSLFTYIPPKPRENFHIWEMNTLSSSSILKISRSSDTKLFKNVSKKLSASIFLSFKVQC